MRSPHSFGRLDPYDKAHNDTSTDPMWIIAQDLCFRVKIRSRSLGALLVALPTQSANEKCALQVRLQGGGSESLCGGPEYNAVEMHTAEAPSPSHITELRYYLVDQDDASDHFSTFSSVFAPLRSDARETLRAGCN